VGWNVPAGMEMEIFSEKCSATGVLPSVFLGWKLTLNFSIFHIIIIGIPNEIMTIV